MIILGLGALLIGPQQAIRQSAARPDNLRLASAIVAAHEQPGDVVFYLPVNMHVLGTGYPAPFLRLRDIALAESPIASATLTGTEITSPALLKSRFTDVRRVWVVTGNSNYTFPVPVTPGGQGEDGLAGGRGHAHHRPLAGRRGHAHAVRVLTALRRVARRGLRRRTTPSAGCRTRWPAAARGSCGGRGAAATSRSRPACP